MIKSPCVNVCILDEEGKVCIGCKRSVEEIMKWTNFSKKDRTNILIALKNRKLI